MRWSAGAPHPEPVCTPVERGAGDLSKNRRWKQPSASRRLHMRIARDRRMLRHVARNRGVAVSPRMATLEYRRRFVSGIIVPDPEFPHARAAGPSNEHFVVFRIRRAGGKAKQGCFLDAPLGPACPFDAVLYSF